jgi:hypothetical protein
VIQAHTAEAEVHCNNMRVDQWAVHCKVACVVAIHKTAAGVAPSTAL